MIVEMLPLEELEVIDKAHQDDGHGNCTTCGTDYESQPGQYTPLPFPCDVSLLVGMARHLYELEPVVQAAWQFAETDEELKAARSVFADHTVIDPLVEVWKFRKRRLHEVIWPGTQEVAGT